MKRKMIKCSLILLLTLSAYFVPKYFLKSGILAIPGQPGVTPPLVVNKDTSTPFELPFDATKLVEPNLVDQSVWPKPFYGYVQNPSKVIDIQLGAQRIGFGGDAQTYFGFVLQLNDGTYAVGVENRSDYEAIAGTANRQETVVYKVDSAGRVMNLINIGSGKQEGFSASNVNTATNYTQAFQSYGVLNSDGTISVTYAGFLPSSNAVSSNQMERWTSRVLKLNPNLTINAEYTPDGVIADRVAEKSEAFDGSVLFSGFTAFRRADANTAQEPMSLPVYNFKDSNYQKIIDLKVPKFSDYIGGTYPAGIQKSIVRVYKTKEGYLGKVIFGNAPWDNLPTELVKEVHVLFRWDKNGNILEQVKSTDSFLPAISNLDTVYFQRTVGSDVVSEAWNVGEPLAKKSAVFKTKSGNSLNLIRNKNPDFNTEFDFYGIYKVDSPEMAGFNFDKGIVVGTMDSKMQVKSISSVNVDSGVKSLQIYPNKFNKEKLFIAGYVTPESPFVTPHNNKWMPKRSGTGNAGNWVGTPYVYVGEMNKLEDYAPVIKKITTGASEENKFKIIDIDQLKNEPNLLDKLLLTGNGTPEVYDTKDTNTSLIDGQTGKEWLENRLNKNPNNLDLPIDWTKLGYDGGAKYGPNKVTYFVTDSQKQTTSTTRIVNNINSDTVREKDLDGRIMGIGASNFSIHINDLPTKLKSPYDARKLSDALGWDFRDGNIVDDWEAEYDESGDMSVFVIDENELKTIQEAKVKYDELKDGEDASKIIKPYPLTISYDSSFSGWLEGEELKRTIMVFVTDDQTVVDAKENTVLYAFNTKVQLKEAQQKSSPDMVHQMKVSAWNYKMQSTDKPYPKKDILANVTDPTPPNSVDKNKTGINNVTEIGDYFVKFTYKDSTNQLAIAKVVNDPVKLHIRQVLLEPTIQLAIPKQGYVQLMSQKPAPDEGQLDRIHVEVPSKEDMVPADYQEVGLELVYLYWGYQLKPIMPEYYQYDGIIITDSNSPHNSHERKKDVSLYLDYRPTEEYWVTIYVTPALNGKEPKFYNWDYQNRRIN